MKDFMSNLMKKMTPKGLAIFAGAIGVLSFIIGILKLCHESRTGVVGFLNSIILLILFLALAYEIYKNEKHKALIVVFILASAYILTSLGDAVSCFMSAGDIGAYNPTMTASNVLAGVGNLSLLIGGAAMLVACLYDKIKKPTCNLATEIAFFIAAVLFFVVGILGIVIGKDSGGLTVTISFLNSFQVVVTTVFLAFASYQLVK